ncbi:MAG: SDR family oxidoreductase [Chlorobiaceae bacterium]|nr:SDR family oxidoreductase [Chlorobiaceae bacterium]
MKNVLVVGAGGYVGRYVACEFKKRGYRVRAMVRDSEVLKREGPSHQPAIHDVVDEIWTGDATRPETLNGICDGIDLVFSSMGLSRSDSTLSFEDIDHLANRRILELARQAGVKKFEYVSVFRAELMMGSDVVRAHEAFVKDLEASGLDYTIIRPNAYFSDMAQFLNIARKGLMFWLGDGDNKMNPIHGADLAVVCVDAAEGKANSVDVGGPDMFTFRSLFELAFEAVGKEPQIIFLPLWLGEAALWTLRLFNPKLADAASFFVDVNKMENDAPAYGSHRLRDFFREMAAEGGQPAHQSKQ